MNRTVLGQQGNQLLGGRYELVSVLGEGGMAEVYRAVDHALGRPGAVTSLPISPAMLHAAEA